MIRRLILEVLKLLLVPIQRHLHRVALSAAVKLLTRIGTQYIRQQKDINELDKVNIYIEIKTPIETIVKWLYQDMFAQSHSRLLFHELLILFRLPLDLVAHLSEAVR